MELTYTLTQIVMLLLGTVVFTSIIVWNVGKRRIEKKLLEEEKKRKEASMKNKPNFITL